MPSEASRRQQQVHSVLGDARLSVTCGECGVSLIVVTSHPDISDEFPFFVRCLACDARVFFDSRVGRPKSVSVAE